MELGLEALVDRPDSLRPRLRPVAIWLGLVTFLAGAIRLGATLAGGTDPFTGPVLLLLGVALVGGGFAMNPTTHALDPDVEFDRARRHFVVGVSALFLLLAAGVVVLAAL